MQLYRSSIEYLVKFVFPSRLSPKTNSWINPPLGLSGEWAINTIHNVALYVTRVGIHPPIGPLHIGQMGVRRVKTALESSKLVEQIDAGLGIGGVGRRWLEPAPRVDEEQRNGGQLEARSNTTSQWREPPNHSWQSVEETLFKDVPTLPFHQDVFGVLANALEKRRLHPK